MADRRPRGTDADLSQRLRDLGDALDYPPTPDIAFAVRRRIAATHGTVRAPAQRARPRWPRVLAIALVCLLVLGLLGAAFPPTRRAIAQRLGLRNVAIVVTPVPIPTATAAAIVPVIVGATTAPSLVERGLGTPTMLMQAQTQVTFPIRVPTAVGYQTPDAVFVATPPPGGRVALVYRVRADPSTAIPDTDIALLITEFRGGLDAGLFTKGVPSAGALEAVQVRDASGYWIAGGLRLFLYRDAGGAVVQDMIRTAGNTLLWERDGVVYRIETTLSRDEAVRIAASIP